MHNDFGGFRPLFSADGDASRHKKALSDPEKMDDERRQQLLDEAQKTVSGLDKGFDPREAQMLDEEQKRLRRIADALMPPS